MVARARLLAALLFVSGACALVYQTLWLRRLGLVFGVTAYATSTVLAAFMAGLALGSFLSGRLSDRVRHPLRWFAATELLIAASALATPLLLDALETIYRYAYAGASAHLSVLTLIRFVCSFAVLIVPTTLMGATAPLALRAAVERAPELGTRAAMLYAANTAGALAGALVTGFYLVSGVGIGASFLIAAAFNGLVGVSALVLSFSSPPPLGAGPSPRPPEGGRHVHPGDVCDPRDRRVVLAVTGVSGFTALALEIVWFRSLVMFLPATTYAFTSILAVVLAGIALGSAIATWWLRRGGDWVLRLGALHMGIALTALASFSALAWSYNAGLTPVAVVPISALAVLPATTLMGLTFPIGLHCWAAREASDEAGTGDRVGRYYLVNLTGAIAGAASAGFALIPFLGTRASLVAAAALSGVAGASLLLRRLAHRPRAALVVLGAGGALMAWAAIVVPDPLQAVLARRYAGEELLWRGEDAQTTVSITRAADDRVLMYLDGLHQANDSRSMIRTHRLIGTLAMTLHPDPKTALVVGLGGGGTAEAVASYAEAHLDIVELSPSVVEGSEFFRHINGDVLYKPNVSLTIGDGRNHLLLTDRKYDVVTADLIEPFHAGAGNLYSVEYFRLASRVLTEDGVMLQWVGRRPDTQYRLIARTFLTAFPHATAWAGGTLLVGTNKPLRVSQARLEHRMQMPAFRARVDESLGAFGGLRGLFTATPEQFRDFLGDGPILTDDRPLVEYFLSIPENEPEPPYDQLRGDLNQLLIP